jgi:hypothetical protein
MKIETILTPAELPARALRACVGANRRCRGSRREPAVAQLATLGRKF